MQMIRQYHHRDDVKRMGLPNFSHGVAKYINVFGEEAAFSICEIDSEKIGGSGYVRFAVSHQSHLMECWADKALAQPTRCKSTAEERSAGNPHATFCGSRRWVTAFGDPVWRLETSGYPIRFLAYGARFAAEEGVGAEATTEAANWYE